MVEGPKILRRQEEKLEDVVEVSKLQVGQKVVIWDDFSSDSEKPMWLAAGEIGRVTSVDGDGDALIAFAGKDKGGRSLSTIVKKKNFGKLRCQAPQAAKAAAPAKAAPPPPPRKVLACGDAMGNVGKLFAMVEAQASKVGPFDAVFCVGAFLPLDLQSVPKDFAACIAGTRKAPAPIFFVDDGPALVQACPQGRRLCEDLHYLGGYGLRKISGLQVAFLSGHYDPAVYDTPDADFVGGAFTSRAVAELRRLAHEQGRQGVDILLTCGWPSDLELRLQPEEPSPADPDDSRPSWQLACAPPIRELCLALEPRYHIFGTADLFYSRPPFQTPNKGHICRLVGLGCVGSTSKQRKWLHALSLSPMEEMRRQDLQQLPSNATPNPFLPSKKRPAPPESSSSAATRQQKLPRLMPDQEASARGQIAEVLAAGDVLGSDRVTELCEFGKRLSGTPLKAGAALSAEAIAARAKREAASKAAAAAQSQKQGQSRGAADDTSGAAGQQTRPAEVAAGGSSGRDDDQQGQQREVEEDDDEVPRTEEGLAKREAAKQWLLKDPRKGTVRYTFKDEGPLGLRFSKDVPPWILEVRDGSLAAKKAPRVPVAGIVLAVNGYELCEKDCEAALQALKKRPVVLDVEWPVDQGTPTVMRA